MFSAQVFEPRWNAFEPIHCKGVIVSKHFFVTIRECYDQKKISKNEIAAGEVFVRYGAFSQKFDGRFEIVDEIRIQYYHVVLKARGDFILGEYSKPAKMMSWPEVEKNIYKRQGNKSHKDKDRCVIIGPKMNPTNPDAHFNVIKWSIWSNKKHLEGFRGHEGVWWAKPKGQKPYSPEESDLGAPAFCWNFEKHEWQVFGFVLQQLPRNDENFGILERIVIEFYQIREERIEMYEHNKPIWEKINQNMIGRKELRNEL